MPKHAIVGAALLLATTAPAAWADLSAEEIWSDWQEMYARFGMEMAAESEDYADGVLTLENVSFESDMGGVVSSQSGIGPIRLVEQGDGSVVIEVPERMEAVTQTTVEGETIEQTAVMTNENLQIVAREDDDGVRTYDVTADAAGYELETPEMEDDPDVEATISMTMTGMVAQYVTGVDGNENAFNQTLSADALGFDMDLSGPEPFTLDYDLRAVTMEAPGSYADTTIEEITSLADMGILIDGEVSHGGGTTLVSGGIPEEPFEIRGTTQSGSLDFDITEDALAYAVESVNGEYVASIPGFPLPVNASIAESRLGIAMPIGAGPEERAFGLDLVARELTIDDTLWALFDPTGQLPREAATLVVDLDGTAVMTADIMGGPEAMAGMTGAPGEMKSLTLGELLLSVAGAELRGSGDLDFPTPDPTAPVGTIELALDGGMTLLDRLVALGFVPAQQAGFVKAMAGTVTEEVGEDQLESVIEFTPGGGVSANGMPLR